VPGQPVFYLDTAKTSTMEGAATTVYATGGRGNTRLLAWEGEKTLTFTVEDALLSPVSFSMLSGAGLVKGLPAAAGSTQPKVHFHQTSTATVSANGIIDLNDALAPGDTICPTAPIYVLDIDEGGDLTGAIQTGFQVPTSADVTETQTVAGRYLKKGSNFNTGTVMVDYYVLKPDNKVSELQIDAEHFGGYFYVEADTLFRSQIDGKDYPANLTFPNVKIQSNFTFSMAATGDPSTFTFTMDAFPGYTYFDRTKQVLCAIQIADDNADITEISKPVFPHPAATKESRIPESYSDSVDGTDANEKDEVQG